MNQKYFKKKQLDIDCPDGTDEMNCPNKENDCSGMLKCANVSTCYMESW